jgi:hypothetical protein
MRYFIYFICVLFFVGCVSIDQVDSKFKTGEIVKIKITGQKGMVVFGYCSQNADTKEIRHCYYRVRINMKQYRTHTHVLDSDAPITPELAVMEFREFELESYNTK